MPLLSDTSLTSNNSLIKGQRMYISSFITFSVRVIVCSLFQTFALISLVRRRKKDKQCPHCNERMYCDITDCNKEIALFPRLNALTMPNRHVDV